ncbi:MAG: signal peptidase I [Candidatus Berkelbacteria bacterium Licking1014_2]|uniref:Signal peptidase I n=1 Tax=Candidatus Berkelbacteria bacterium Licking1014_2 TaxID=2017146 RepID=A0A554LWP4_9BACT|nr:MAG: signal peptidase I [Candidatus Berkelbacteria bacterium Licking1014_2]
MVKPRYIIGCLFELTKGALVLGIIVLLLHFFVATIFIVDGISMEPNFQDKEVVIVDKLSYLIKTPQRGEVVIVRFPGRESDKYIKRVVGLPADKLEIKNGKIYLNDQALRELYLDKDIVIEPDKIWVVPDNQYFLMGDNRAASSDSRIWGTAPRQNLIGRAYLKIWPTSDIGLIPIPF